MRGRVGQLHKSLELCSGRVGASSKFTCASSARESDCIRTSSACILPLCARLSSTLRDKTLFASSWVNIRRDVSCSGAGRQAIFKPKFFAASLTTPSPGLFVLTGQELLRLEPQMRQFDTFDRCKERESVPLCLFIQAL